MIAAIKRGIGRAVFGLLRAVYPPRERIDLGELDAKRILAVQGLRIGDTLATLPAISALRARWPDAEVVSLAPPAPTEIVELSGLAHRCIVWPQGGSRLGNGKAAVAGGRDVDLAVVFDCTLTSMLVADRAGAAASIGYDSCNRGFGLTHPIAPPAYWNRPVAKYPSDAAVEPQSESWLRLLREAGIDAASARPKLTPRPEDLAWAREFLGEPSGPVVALHPGAEPSYQWLPDRFAAVGDALAEELGATIVITGGPGDAALAEAIAAQMQREPRIAAGRTSLGQMAALLSEAALLVSVDTSAGHVAAAVGAPVVSLFGPGDARIWAPQGERVAVLTAPGLDCLGCKTSRCKQDAHPCMAGITVDMVLAAAREMR